MAQNHIGDTNKMVTAVEWYYQQTVIEGKTNYAELCEQAKQMEKEQLKGMYIEGAFAQMRYFDGKEFIAAEQYYNETYKK